MADTPDKPLWYAAGLNFSCVHCGQCCAGPGEGYVWVTPAEIAVITDHLGLSLEEMQRTYVRCVGGGWSLQEHRDNRDCVFLSPADNGRRACKIYPIRPTQCRTWPFWPSNLRSVDSWAHAATRCPGINQRDHFSFDEIQARRNITSR